MIVRWVEQAVENGVTSRRGHKWERRKARGDTNLWLAGQMCRHCCVLPALARLPQVQHAHRLLPWREPHAAALAYGRCDSLPSCGWMSG